MSQPRNVILGFAIVGFLAVALITARFGAGVYPDSLFYLDVAEHIAEGNGIRYTDFNSFFELPLTHFPPGYPVALALTTQIGLSPLQGAQWINMLCFAVLMGWIMWVSWRITHSIAITLLSGAFAFFQTSLLNVHYFALSEPLFLLIFVWGMFALAEHINTRQRWRLALIGLWLGSAYLVRYAAIILIPTGVLAILLFQQGTWRNKIQHALFLGIPGLIPPIALSLYNQSVAGQPTSRQFAVHWITLPTLQEGIQTIGRWIVPVIPFVVAVIVIVVFIALVGVWLTLVVPPNTRLRTLQRWVLEMPVLLKIWALFSVLHLTFLVITISFFDPATPLDWRLLSPIQIGALLAVAYFGTRLYQSTQSVMLQRMVRVIVFGVLSLNVVVGIVWILDRVVIGEGYTSLEWRDSKIVAYLQGLPPDSLVFTNSVQGVFYWGNLPSEALPQSWDTVQPIDLPENALVVLFYQGMAQKNPTLEALQSVISFDFVAEFDDGVVLRVRD